MKRKPYARPFSCVYCGYPCNGRACPSHRDLLRLDPYFTLSTSRGPFVTTKALTRDAA